MREKSLMSKQRLLRSLHRCILLLIIATILMSTTGCGTITYFLKAKVNAVKEEQRSNEMANTLSFAKMFPKTKSTQTKMNAYEEAEDKYQAAATSYKNAMLSGVLPWPWQWHPFKKAKMKKAKMERDNKYESFNKALSSDKVFKQAQEDAKNNKKQSVTSNPMIVVIIVILLLLGGIVAVVYFVSRKKSTKPARIVANNQPRKQISKSNRSGEMKVDYDRLLGEVCSKAGVSTDLALNKFGNPRTAYERLNIMVGKGMSSSEICAALGG